MGEIVDVLRGCGLDLYIFLFFFVIHRFSCLNCSAQNEVYDMARLLGSNKV